MGINIFQCCKKKNYDNSELILNEQYEIISCIILGNNESYYIGFLCNLQIPKILEIKPFLITTNQNLGKDEIELNQTIKFVTNSEQTPFEIKIDSSRKTYIDEENGITLIEIKYNDGLNFHRFLELNNKKQVEINNNEDSFYLFHYDNKKMVKYKCKIKNTDEGNNCFKYECNCKENEPLEGCPIIKKLQDSYEIIGMHKEINEKKEYIGLFLKNPINKFLEEINKKDIILRYKIEEGTNLRLFGDEFVENNNQICTIFINGKEEKIFAEIESDENIKLNDEKILEIRLKGIQNITDMSNIFLFCNNLISISNLTFDTSKITNMCNVFCGCESLKAIPDISQWNIENVTDISGMFSGCSSLNSIPDISNWNTKNLTDINNLFSGSSSLKSLPDISKWDTSKVTNMNNIFNKCSSLESLPDISKWNTNKVSNMNNIFSECSVLKTVPDISNWQIGNLINITRMFYKCPSLISIPDISKWDIKNIKHMNSLFEGCSSLQSLPDISIWNTQSVTSLYSLFSGCSSLISLPDISKWNTRNVTDMNALFYDCKSLIKIPDISKWDTNNVTDMSSMFEGCESLKSLPDISKWNINKVEYKSDMFSGCKNDLNIPPKFKEKDNK